jgi:hypothetical protein
MRCAAILLVAVSASSGCQTDSGPGGIPDTADAGFDTGVEVAFTTVCDGEGEPSGLDPVPGSTQIIFLGLAIEELGVDAPINKVLLDGPSRMTVPKVSGGCNFIVLSGRYTVQVVDIAKDDVLFGSDVDLPSGGVVVLAVFHGPPGDTVAKVYPLNVSTAPEEDTYFVTIVNLAYDIMGPIDLFGFPTNGIFGDDFLALPCPPTPDAPWTPIAPLVGYGESVTLNVPLHSLMFDFDPSGTTPATALDTLRFADSYSKETYAIAVVWNHVWTLPDPIGPSWSAAQFALHGTRMAPPHPNDNASSPDKKNADVISLFSATYSGSPSDYAQNVDTWLGKWSGRDGCHAQSTVEDYIPTDGGGHEVKLFRLRTYAGIDLIGSNDPGDPEFAAHEIDLASSGMEYLHMDIWTPEARHFVVTLRDAGPDKQVGTEDDAEIRRAMNFAVSDRNQWLSLDLKLSEFEQVSTAAWTGEQLAQIELREDDPLSGGFVYLDNFYFYRAE